MNYIKNYEDLVTTHEQTRAGFLSIALEKNRVSNPYIKAAYAFKEMTANVNEPESLKNIIEIKPFLLASSGLSEKSLNYLNEIDRDLAIKELIDNFLKPAGEKFIDECIYRYLIIKGDAVGGTMRNRIGILGQERLIRGLLSCMKVSGINYQWLPNVSGAKWIERTNNDVDIEKTMKAITWNVNGKSKILAFNLNMPQVKKNVDICLFNGNFTDYNNGKIVKETSRVLMLGELKGGIDPAGADEHWKTANSALERIRVSFKQLGINMKTSFVGAAIENAMAKEIFQQMENNILDFAANLTNDSQLVAYCNWLLYL